MPSESEIDKPDSQPDKRKNLVIACGTNHRACRNHPSKDWISVDTNIAIKPDILKSVDDLKPQDFPGGDPKFEIVFVEGITSFISPSRIAVLNPLMASDSALIIYPAYLSCLSGCENIPDFNLTNFIQFGAVCFLFRGEADPKKICETYLKDLCNGKPDDVKEEITNHISLLLMISKRVQDQYKEKALNPTLVSMITHIRAHKNQRENRPHNLFKNKKYKEFYSAIETKIISFSEGNLPLEDLIKEMNSWKDKLPSASKPVHKLPVTYIKLADLLEQLVCVVTNYHHASLKLKSAGSKLELKQ